MLPIWFRWKEEDYLWIVKPQLNERMLWLKCPLLFIPLEMVEIYCMTSLKMHFIVQKKIQVFLCCELRNVNQEKF